MAIYNVYVPPTMEQGIFRILARNNYMTIAKDALQTYNGARAHDGQPPLNRMPNGTTYTRTDAMLRLHEYRDNEPGVSFKVVARGL